MTEWYVFINEIYFIWIQHVDVKANYIIGYIYQQKSRLYKFGYQLDIMNDQVE